MPIVRELFVQYRPHPAGLQVDAAAITTARAAALLTKLLGAEPYETFAALHLDTRHRLIGIQTIGRGELAACAVSLRALLAAAIGEKNTAAVILAHNHPSGDPTPSPDDLTCTARIQAAAAMFDVQVLDHIIIGQETYCSFVESGRMRYL